MQHDFESVLKGFADDVTTKFGMNVAFGPEDQLKAPVKTVLEEAGRLLELDINAVTGENMSGEQIEVMTKLSITGKLVIITVYLA